MIIPLINRFPFGNPAQKGYFLYSKVPSAVLQGIEQGQFQKTVQFTCKNSSFYKERFKKLGIDPSKVRRPEDLGDFFTTAEDIRENVEGFVCIPPDTAYETTGTTSKKTKRVYFSRQEIREAGWAGAVGLWGVGVRPEDRVVSAFDYAFWVSGPVLQASCEVLGCFHIEAGRMDPLEFYERVSEYRVTVIVGDPSWFLRFTEVAEKKGPWPIKLMIGGGENLTEEVRRYIESVWKADFLLSYGQTEAFGAIGMESLDKEGYHLNEFHNYFEIVHPDSSGYGELVYTTLNRRVMPLIRYRSGDITRFIQAPSKSGFPGRRIEKLKGRVNEWTATAMGNIAPWMFEPLLSGLESVRDWQVVLSKDGMKDLIEFCVEADTRAEEELKKKFFSDFQSAFPEMWKFYEKSFFRLGFRVLPKGTLRKGRKLLRIVDERKF